MAYQLRSSIARNICKTLELRQNTAAFQRAAAATYSDGWRDIGLFGVEDQDFPEILKRPVDGGELTDLERFRLDFFCRTEFLSWRSSFLQQRVASLPEEI